MIWHGYSHGRCCFFSIWVFFHECSQYTGQQGKEEVISLTLLCHFHLLHRHLDINRAITAGSSPLHIASSRSRTGNLLFLSAIHLPLSYMPKTLTTTLRPLIVTSLHLKPNSLFFIKVKISVNTVMEKG